MPHLSLEVHFCVADASPGHMRPFLCCGTRKETYCIEEGESLQHLPGNNEHKLPLAVSLSGCVKQLHCFHPQHDVRTLFFITLMCFLIDSFIHLDFH